MIDVAGGFYSGFLLMAGFAFLASPMMLVLRMMK